MPTRACSVLLWRSQGRHNCWKRCLWEEVPRQRELGSQAEYGTLNHRGLAGKALRQRGLGGACWAGWCLASTLLSLVLGVVSLLLALLLFSSKVSHAGPLGQGICIEIETGEGEPGRARNESPTRRRAQTRLQEFACCQRSCCRPLLVGQALAVSSFQVLLDKPFSLPPFAPEFSSQLREAHWRP